MRFQMSESGKAALLQRLEAHKQREDVELCALCFTNVPAQYEVVEAYRGETLRTPVCTTHLNDMQQGQHGLGANVEVRPITRISED